MKIGILGPSKLRDEILVKKVAELIAKTKAEIVITPDKGSTSEFFAETYLKKNGKKIYSVIPMNDTEFGFSWLNLKLGENINCNTWRNQPEKLNEESDILMSLGYCTGGIIEICYSKWFKKKPVYIIKEFGDTKLPKELEKDLDLHYIFIEELEDKLK